MVNESHKISYLFLIFVTFQKFRGILDKLFLALFLVINPNIQIMKPTPTSEKIIYALKF